MQKTVFITGATGFVGRALVARLLGAGYRVRVWVRSVEAARARLGADVEIYEAVDDQDGLIAALDGAGGVINLAGEPLFGGRWSEARKRALVESRVALTGRIARALAELEHGPKVLISASAIGYYGDRGDAILDEDSPPAADFLAQVCVDWEEAARSATQHGVRVVTPRIGIVLGKEGGALAKMLPPFRVGLGGRLGSGRQYVSWIHLSDLVELLIAALEDPSFTGPINAVAPTPVTNLELTRVLARALRRPAISPVPAAALRALLGEAAGALLGGQRVIPARAEALGFRFRFDTLESALADVLDDGGVTFSRTETRHELLEQKTSIDAPIEDVFELFSKPANLGLMTPSALGFELEEGDGSKIEARSELTYTIRLGPIPMGWRSRIEVWDPPRRFADAQLKGPYAYWWHEHLLSPAGEGTVMIDRVHYRVPFGPLGRIANRFFVRPMLRRIFAFRAQMSALRFAGRPRPRLSSAA